MTLERAARLPKNALIMHPGPMNRGVEISAEVAGLVNAVIIDQVKNGVAVRMAVLFLLLGSGYGLANVVESTIASGERQ
jgi:aspartate carbamoyltransferase catalytic subunit